MDKVAELTRKAGGCTDDILFEIYSYHTLVSKLKERITQFSDLASALKAESSQTINE